MSKHLPMVFDDELFGPVIADSRANETLVSGNRVSHETFERASGSATKPSIFVTPVGRFISARR